jgi:aryl-alcohol dehydrogenase-like predicted oxidoreductase
VICGRTTTLCLSPDASTQPQRSKRPEARQLGGRYTSASTLPRNDVRGRPPAWLRWFTDGHPNVDYLQRIDAVRDLLTAGGRTLAQGAIAWIWARDDRAIPLAGFRNASQVEDNAGALRYGPLDADEYATVERILGRRA